MKKRSALLAASALALGITTAPAAFAAASGAPCGALDIASRARAAQ